MITSKNLILVINFSITFHQTFVQLSEGKMLQNREILTSRKKKLNKMALIKLEKPTNCHQPLD